MTVPEHEHPPVLPLPREHKSSILADRLISILAVVTIVLLAAMAGAILYLVVAVTSVSSGNQHLVTQVAAQEKQLAAQQKLVLAAQLAAKQATIASCVSSNASRAKDVTVWEHVLALPGTTAAQRAAVSGDLKLVHQAYAQRDCAASGG